MQIGGYGNFGAYSYGLNKSKKKEKKEPPQQEQQTKKADDKEGKEKLHKVNEDTIVRTYGLNG